jgi:L-amino acid N-acyltransferase YncA
MGISTALKRLAEYHRRHGFRSTIKRARVAALRALTRNRMVLFYYDLSGQTKPARDLASSLQVERKTNANELSPPDLNDMVGVWNPALARRNMEERFGLGASLWLIKSDGKLAGYGWTLRGRTVEPHYFPLGQDDVQFLDFYVFSKYRGRAIDWFLITQILRTLAAEGMARAFGEAAEWNQASLASFKMSSFRRLGYARKVTIFGRTFVHWIDDEARQPDPVKKSARRLERDKELASADLANLEGPHVRTPAKD